MFAHAIVATDRPRRYAKQLVSHMGHKCPVEEITDGHRITLRRELPTTGWFEVLLINPETAQGDPENEKLVLIAEAEDAERLERVEDVVARHLVRFGEADGLSVDWIAGDLPARS